jgi:hypothetical protein
MLAIEGESCSFAGGGLRVNGELCSLTFEVQHWKLLEKA